MVCGRNSRRGSGSAYLNVMTSPPNRQDSQCEQKKQEFHNQLLEYVRANDIDNIRQLINEHNDLLTIKYPNPYFKSIIPIARFNLFRKTNPQTLEVLIDIGFHINNAANRHEELIYFTAASCNNEKLQEVMKCIKNKAPEDLNNTREGDTALMFLIKYANPIHPDFVSCARILVEGGVDVNIPDYSNCSPIVKAAYLYHTHARKHITEQNQLFLHSFKEIVKIILRREDVDVDSHKWYEKTAREYITLHQICHLTKPSKFRGFRNWNVKTKLFSLVIAREENKIPNVKKVKSYDLDDGENTLLQLACILKLENAVKFFLRHGANPNSTTLRNKDTPLEMAAKRNHHNIFEILLNYESTCVTHEIYCNFASHRGNKIKDKYFMWILSSEKVNVDFVCKQRNTPLHYAAMFSENQTVLDLLRRGASLVIENKSKEQPIDYMDPRILKKFIDQCVESRATQNIYHKKSVISFNYHFLLKNDRRPVETKDSFIDIEEAGRNLITKKDKFVSETEVALTITEFPEMFHLLKHPVISSFLYVKWYKIKTFFWVIMLFHIWCYLHFFNYFYDCSSFNNSQVTVPFWIFIVSYIAYVGFIITRIVVSRSDLQMHFHIYLQCCLITLIFVTVCLPSRELRKQFSVFGIILCAFSLIFWSGYHPKMSTQVAMLQRVSYNFFKILLCYCILILAFAMSFYILFHNVDAANAQNETEQAVLNDTEQHESLFANLGTATFKTFVMMSGEFETSEFKFHQSQVSSYIVFLLFVFMISLILMNLLTGVAVTDTENIQNEAEIVGHIATIRFIRFIEMILQPSFFPSMLYRSKINIDNCFLLPNVLSDYKLTIYPNLNGKVRCELNSALQNLRLNKKIVKDAMNVVIKREVKNSKLMETENLVGTNDLKALEDRVEEIAEKQKIYYKRFQESLDQLSNNLRMITENFEIVAE